MVLNGSGNFIKISKTDILSAIPFLLPKGCIHGKT